MSDALKVRDNARELEAEPFGIEPFEHGALAPAAGTKSKPHGKRKALLFGLFGVVAAAGGGVAGHHALVGAHYVTTENAYVGASSAQINAQAAGPIADVLVEDTDAVRAGDALAIIDPEDAMLAVARAEAEYERTLQRVRQYFAQEAAADAQVRARQAELDRAEGDYGRRSQLAASGAVSEEELTAARATRDAAQANLDAARQTLESQRALTLGSTPEEHPETTIAFTAWETARLTLERTTVRAPIDGVIAQRNVQIGQRVEIGQPLMTVTPLQDVYVDANFKEGQLDRVRVGQPVHLVSDLYGPDVVYHGEVAGLGGGTGSAFAIIPAQNATGNWIKVVQRVPVRVSLEPEELAAHPLRVGLSMEARIDVRDGEDELTVASN